MRCIWQPQPHTVDSGSWCTSRRGRCGGSACRFGDFLPALSPAASTSTPNRLISRPSSARSSSSVSCSRLFCSVLPANFSLVAANFMRLSTATSWVSLSMSACLNAASRSRCSSSASLARSCSSRAATSDINDSRACRNCGSKVSNCCALIMERDRRASRRRSHRHIRQLPSVDGLASDHADDAGLSQALPRQAQHQRVELRSAQAQGTRAIAWPDELARVEPPGDQPHADAVVHEDLHAVGSPVGEDIGVMRMRGAEDTDHARQRGFGAQAHVQRLHSHPDRVHADQLVTSRSQAALRLSMGRLARRVVPLRWISTSTRTAAGSGDAAGSEGCADIGNCMNAGVTTSRGCATSVAALPAASDSRTQRRSMFAFSPLASATAATDVFGWRANSMIRALNSSECRRQLRLGGAATAVFVSKVSMCPRKSPWTQASLAGYRTSMWVGRTHTNKRGRRRVHAVMNDGTAALLAHIPSLRRYARALT